MVLLASIAAGILTGWGYARYREKTWRSPVFRATWLVVLGFLPQFLAFYLPQTRDRLPDQLVALALVSSQLLLLIFSFVNLRLPGMPLLMLGLAFNLAVILANGGFMPLTVEAAALFVDPIRLNSLAIGERVSSASKDILLPEAQVLLPWLADRFASPSFLSYRFAFSLGDILVAIGAFWLLVDNRSTPSTSSKGMSECLPNP